jgi:putative glutathione S-transferase
MATDKKEETKTTWKFIGKKGEFIRKESAFRNQVTADGSSGFQAESDRYHLYVSLACPWAHRTLIVRKQKGLEDCISCTVVHWLLDDRGWFFASDSEPAEDSTPDTINNCAKLKELYFMVDKDYDGRFTVPVLWDKQTKTIVNNESSEIIRMLNREFNAFCKTEQQRVLDFYPENLRTEIDEVNDWIYPSINNGVYKSGFAQSQEAYDTAVTGVFEGLDKVENILATKRYLTGNQFTEGDIRLFTTLVRFDQVYHGHFKCNKKRIVDYPNIWAYTRDIYQMGGIKSTVNMLHIKKHYMVSHKHINPFQITSVGPDLDFNAPHGRKNLFQ